MNTRRGVRNRLPEVPLVTRETSPHISYDRREILIIDIFFNYPVKLTFTL